tara:strand:+ start:414 stop:641 length:228 start_codon:yes stop_codon:yes gene_type:complete
MELILKISFFALIALAILVMVLSHFKKNTGILFSVLIWATATLVTLISFYNGSLVVGVLMAIVSFGTLLFFKSKK